MNVARCPSCGDHLCRRCHENGRCRKCGAQLETRELIELVV